ncbi:MAG: hypothetical protein ACHQII_06530, partial [Bacteroidia bacterium]
IYALKSFSKYYLIAFFVFALCNFALIAQSKDKPTPDELFEEGDYVSALKEYEKIEKKYPSNENIKRRLADCYLYLHGDKSKAIPYLQFLYEKNNEDTSVLLKLGMAYQHTYKLPEAIACYAKYSAKAPPAKKPIIDRYIETCENAKELMKYPVSVTFENLGPEVNTKYADYYPFVTKDEKTLYFTTRREETMGSFKSVLGYFTSDIFVSTVDKGQWTKARSMGFATNTAEDEECVGITPDGKNMIIYVDRENMPSDLLHTEVSPKSGNFTKPIPFNEPVNTKSLELEGFYTPDANTLYFVSSRKNGQGGADIYITHRLPNGEWGIPKNLGPTINTAYDEGFPVISDDGQTLYFASKGHTSMGGYDIFKSRWDSVTQQWQKPINIGYPVNTTDDDLMFSLTGKGRDGYLSAWRKEGYGDLDIYKVIFTAVEQPLTAIHGNVQSADTTKKDIDIYITISNTKTKEDVDAKNVNLKTGRYVFIVEPGKYIINITGKGFKPIQQEITIYDKSDFTAETQYNFTLLPDK